MSASEATRPDRPVLYVDDDDVSRYLLVRALEREGVSVTEAAGVREGLALLRQHRFRLVISDYRMTDGTGTWMLRQAASAGLLEGTEVLLFTGSTHIEGAAGLQVIAKERGPDNILAQVVKLLGTPRQDPRPALEAARSAVRALVPLNTGETERE